MKAQSKTADLHRGRRGIAATSSVSSTSSTGGGGGGGATSNTTVDANVRDDDGDDDTSSAQTSKKRKKDKKIRTEEEVAEDEKKILDLFATFSDRIQDEADEQETQILHIIPNRRRLGAGHVVVFDRKYRRDLRNGDITREAMKAELLRLVKVCKTAKDVFPHASDIITIGMIARKLRIGKKDLDASVDKWKAAKEGANKDEQYRIDVIIEVDLFIYYI
jgi:hypothetical protein